MGAFRCPIPYKNAYFVVTWCFFCIFAFRLMYKKTPISCLWAVAFLALLPTYVWGQQVHTKSGTPVEAHPRIPAALWQTKEATGRGLPGTLIVMSPPEWYDLLRPLLQWKRQQGFDVEWMPAEVSQRDTLRRRLMRRYQTATPLHRPQRHVLLVGDVDRIQSFVGQHTPSGLNNHATDLYYGEYTGDYLPEALVGRLSVADSQQLRDVVQKIVAYEQGLLTTGNGAALLVAGSESRTPAPVTTNGQVNYLRMLASEPLPVMPSHCLYNADTTDYTALLGYLRQPLSLVSYTGHGLRSGWHTPDLTGAMLDTLQGLSATVWVNNCCLTNAYDGLCFGEQLLRHPHGAVGVIGASNETLWNEDYYWAVGAKCPVSLHPVRGGVAGAFDTLLTGWDWNDSTAPTHLANSMTLGRMLYNGCQAVSLSGSVFDAFYWETYCLLGDPTMIPFLRAPDSLWLSLGDSSLMAGTTRIEIATLPYTRVSVTTDSLLLGTAVADGTGHVEVPLSLALTHDSVCLTATRPQGKACHRRATATAPWQGMPAVCRWRQEHDTLHVVLANVGRQEAQGFTLVAAVVGDADTFHIPLLLPDDTCRILVPIPAPWLTSSPTMGLLSVCDSAGQCQTIGIMVMPADSCPQVAALRVSDSTGVPVSHLLPHRDYMLTLTLSHPIDSLAVYVNGEYTPVILQLLQCQIPLRLTADCRAEVALFLYSPCGVDEAHWWLQGYRATETFEDASFDAYPWQSSQVYPWYIDSTASFQGRYCARSAELPDGMKSVLTLSVDVVQGDSIAFWYKVSSEGSDWLYFYIDGRRRGYWSGNTGWNRYAYPIAAGQHLLQWVYAKDGSISLLDDCARIDNITLPLCRWRQPYGHPAADSAFFCAIADPIPFTDTSFAIYPNPATDFLTVETPMYCTLYLYDAAGRCLLSRHVSGDAAATTLDLRPFPAGVYWGAVRKDNLHIPPQKVIIFK